jgi:deoxyribonuclease V
MFLVHGGTCRGLRFKRPSPEQALYDGTAEAPSGSCVKFLETAGVRNQTNRDMRLMMRGSEGHESVKALRLHGWNVTPEEARNIQIRLRRRVELTDRLGRVRFVAGADLAFRLPERRSWERGTGRAIAGVVVFAFPEMEEVERVCVERKLTFPYVPGLLSFREIPALLAAFARLRNSPDLIFCDGQGIAHPRRFGIASHLGVLLDRPTIGCAKSRLIGESAEPGLKAGAWSPLIGPAEKKDGEAPGRGMGAQEVIGAVLRTRAGVRPIYVSQGHRISLARAVEFTLAACDGYRIPRPTREADHFVEAVKRGETQHRK